MIEELFKEKKSWLANRWLDLTLESYSPEARKFFKGKQDEFGNPVGEVLRREFPAILDSLLQGFTPEKLTPCLDSIIRIRAVQDFSPGQAVGFILLLKQAAREALSEARASVSASELVDFEDRIDRTLLLGFEIYSACREQMFRIRTLEVKSRTAKLLERWTGETLPDPSGAESGQGDQP